MRLGPGLTVVTGPQRRGQDEPARGALLRLHRPLVPDRQRARGACASAPASRGWSSTPSVTATRTGSPSASSRARRSGCRSMAPPVDRLTDSRRAAARLGLPPRPARARAGRAGAAARARRPGDRRAVAGPRRHPPRLYGRARAAQRAAGARSAPAAPAAARCRPGTSSSRATASRCALTAPPRSTACAEPFADPRGGARARGRRRADYRPRSRAETAEALAAELAERTDSTSSAASPATGRTATSWRSSAPAASCAPTARAASSASGCSRCCWPSAGSLAAERGAAPLMLLDDVTSELDALRRERLVEALREGGGQSVIATTDLGARAGRRRARGRAPSRGRGAASCRRGLA